MNIKVCVKRQTKGFLSSGGQESELKKITVLMTEMIFLNFSDVRAPVISFLSMESGRKIERERRKKNIHTEVVRVK